MNPGARKGAANRQRVLDLLRRYPGCTNREISAALGLGEMAVSRHVRAIRATWAATGIESAPGGSGQSTESSTMDDQRLQTYGEKAVGLAFNPSGDDAVHQCKARFAAAIDQMDALRKQANDAGSREQARLASVAITDMQTAQMWAVKALTWRD